MLVVTAVTFEGENRVQHQIDRVRHRLLPCAWRATQIQPALPLRRESESVYSGSPRAPADQAVPARNAKASEVRLLRARVPHLRGNRAARPDRRHAVGLADTTAGSRTTDWITDNPRPGDLVVWAYMDKPVSHIGIFQGWNHKGQPMAISALTDPYGVSKHRDLWHQQAGQGLSAREAQPLASSLNP